jgi:hypothetical protein
LIRCSGAIERPQSIALHFESNDVDRETVLWEQAMVCEHAKQGPHLNGASNPLI